MAWRGQEPDPRTDPCRDCLAAALGKSPVPAMRTAGHTITLGAWESVCHSDGLGPFHLPRCTWSRALPLLLPRLPPLAPLTGVRSEILPSYLLQRFRHGFRVGPSETE